MMVGLRGFALGVAVLLALAAQASAGSGSSTGSSSTATAYGIKVLLPNQEPIVAGYVDTAGAASTPGAFAYPEDGGIVRVGTVAGRSRATPVNAQARSDLQQISLFGGEITADAVIARSWVSSRTGEESFGGTHIANLTVLGQSVEPQTDLRVPLGDWGHLTVLQERSQPSGATGARAWVTALYLQLDADHAALPVGTRILVGYAEASASRPPQPKVVAPVAKPEAKSRPLPAPAAEPSSRPVSRRGLGIPPDVARPGTTGPSPLVQIAPKVTRRLTARGYVFPVYGPSGFGDTFGAPRATTVWHHGQDIFAALGAPVLAVADGTLFLVGRNRIGGNRFWLRDNDGNEFYYAHLAAFSPLAVEGGRVQAGDVIGFVGNTGDAEFTPYHLHFEIHPSSLLFLGYDGVVNPYPYLRAWQHLTDVQFPSAAVWAPTIRATGRAPAAGAILLQANDISAANGLDPGSLARAIAPAAGGRGVARELAKR